MTRKLVALLLPAATMTAAADSRITDPPPAPDVTAPVPPEQEPSAADVAEQPVPGNESGRTDVVDPGDSTARVIGRNALFLPKVATDVVLSPVRGTIWLVQDTCTGTLVRSVRGRLEVFDKVRNRDVFLNSGQSYTARPRR